MLSRKPEQSRRNDSLQQSYDSLMCYMKGLASNSRVSVDLDLSLVKEGDPLSDLLQLEILKHQSSIWYAKISVTIVAQNDTEIRYIADYIERLRFADKTSIQIRTSTPFNLQKLIFFIECMKTQSFGMLSLQGNPLGTLSPQDFEALFQSFKDARFKILNLQNTNLHRLSPVDFQQYLQRMAPTDVILIDISRNPILKGANLIDFATQWFSLAPSASSPSVRFFSVEQHCLDIERKETEASIQTMDANIRVHLAESYYKTQALYNLYGNTYDSIMPLSYFGFSEEDNTKIQKFLEVFCKKHIPGDYNRIQICKALFDRGLQKILYAFRTEVEALKSRGAMSSVSIDLSLVKPRDALSDSLHSTFLKFKSSILRADINITLDTQTDAELRYIADYIERLRFADKTSIQMRTSTPFNLQKLIFFIECMKTQSFGKLSLQDSPLGALSPQDFETLFQSFQDARFKVLNLQNTNLHRLSPVDFQQYLQRMAPTDVILIDISRNPILKGANLIDFATQWFSLAPPASSPAVQLFSVEQHYLDIERKETEASIQTMDANIRVHLAESYYNIKILNAAYGCFYSDMIDPNFNLSAENNFKIAKSFTTLYKQHPLEQYGFTGIAKGLTLSPEHRSQWIRDLIKTDEQWLDAYNLKNLQISEIPEKDKLDIFLDGCSRDPFYFFQIHNFDFAFEDAPGHRLLSSFTIMNEALIETDLDTVVSTLTEQSIPLLEQKSERYLGPSLSFVPDCAASIRSQYKNHGNDAGYAILRMITWLGWSATKIDFIWQTLNPELIKSLVKKPSFDEKGKRTPESLRDTFNHVMKQIFDFAHPKARYALTETFLEKLCTDTQASYFTLTAGLSLDTLLPAIPLVAIVLQESNRNLRKNHEALLKTLLPLLGSKQFYGRFQRTMVSGLMSIAHDRSLSPSQKFDIIQEVASKDRQHLKSEWLFKRITELSKQEKKTETDQEMDKLLLALEAHDSLLFEKLQLSLWGFGSQNAAQAFSTKASKDQKKLSSLLQKTDPRIARDLEGIDKAKKPLEAILKTHYEDAHFKRMIARFIMVQGLAGIQRLSALCGLPDIENSPLEASFSGSAIEVPAENFDLQARTIFQEIFGITPEQFSYYPETFAQCHNESAIISYYAKQCTLKGDDAKQAMDVFRSFVQGVLSADSLDFYRTRYDKTKNPHLTVVLEGREPLEKAWAPESGPTDYSTALTTFILEHDIKHRDYKPDFLKLIQEKIFGHQHLDPQHYQNLKQYLAASDASKRAQIKKAIRLAFSDETTQEQYYAKLEWALVELLEMAVDQSISIDKRYEEHLKALQKIYQLLSKIHSRTHHFREDLQTLMRGLKNNKKPVQPINAKSFPDYKLVVTDHYWRLFMAGTDVEGSCQSVDGSADLNKCLMGYVMNGHVKMVAILNPEHVILGRCMIKLLTDKASEEPVLFLEEIYPESLRIDFREALIQYAMQYAAKLGLPLATIQTLPFGYEPTEIPITRDTEDDMIASTSTNESVLECMGGYAVYEYVDAIFQPTQGPYTIEKGIEWIYRPIPKPIQRIESAAVELEPDTLSPDDIHLGEKTNTGNVVTFAYGRNIPSCPKEEAEIETVSALSAAPR